MVVVIMAGEPQDVLVASPSAAVGTLQRQTTKVVNKHSRPQEEMDFFQHLELSSRLSAATDF